MRLVSLANPKRTSNDMTQNLAPSTNMTLNPAQSTNMTLNPAVDETGYTLPAKRSCLHGLTRI